MITHDRINNIAAMDIKSNRVKSIIMAHAAIINNVRKINVITSQTRSTFDFRLLMPNSKIMLTGITYPQQTRPVIQTHRIA